MSHGSRASSPVTLFGQHHIRSISNTNLSDLSVPIAIAIQESIDLTVKGGRQTKQVKTMHTKFETRALGNIKVAFPHSFARLGSAISNSPVLKLRMHCTENILQYYASALIKDLDTEGNDVGEPSALLEEVTSDIRISSRETYSDSRSKNSNPEPSTLFDFTESPVKYAPRRVKVIEFDMDALMQQLTRMYQQSPNSRYYNVDVLRYKIAPIKEFEQSPLQVCAYWKVEPKMIKLRIDFKHSNQACGFNLERLREISFGADLSDFVPQDITVNPVSPSSLNNRRKQSETNNGTQTAGSQNQAAFVQAQTLKSTTYDLITGDSGGQQTFNTRNSVPHPFEASSRELLQPLAIKPQPMPRQSQVVFTQSALETSKGLLKTSPSESFNMSLNNKSSSSNLNSIKLPPPPSWGNHSRANQHQAWETSSSSSAILGNRSQTSSIKSETDDDLNALFGAVATVRAQPALTTNQPVLSANNTTIQPNFTPIISNDMTALKNNGLNDGSVSLMKEQPSNSQHDFSISTGGYQLIAPPDTLSATKQSTAYRTGPQPTSQLADRPYIAFEPTHACWDNKKKQLTWKFDNLLGYYKTDGYGSLLAKLDLRHQAFDATSESHIRGELCETLNERQPKPIEVKFSIVDSTLSKVNLTIDSNGYRMSLLKKEIRSGRYQSEPYVF